MNVYISNVAADHGFYFCKHGQWQKYDSRDIAHLVAINATDLVTQHMDGEYEREYTARHVKQYEALCRGLDRRQEQPIQHALETVAAHSHLLFKHLPPGLNTC
jgi:hypothetical protein